MFVCVVIKTMRDFSIASLEAATAMLDLNELISWVRHSKMKKLKEALDPLPNKTFDPALVSVPYADDVGTAYIDAYEREAFNLNKTDDHGNSLLLISAQNGSDKIAKLLIQKGANPNHQNKLGQTAGHFANAYEFYDYLGWLFDPNGGGADDQLKNKEGLGVYDGITGDG